MSFFGGHELKLLRYDYGMHQNQKQGDGEEGTRTSQKGREGKGEGGKKLKRGASRLAHVPCSRYTELASDMLKLQEEVERVW